MTEDGTRNAYLFTVRWWLEQMGNGAAEWRGKVVHVTSGDVRYFRDWQMLLAFLSSQLQDERSDEPIPINSSNPVQPDVS